MPLTRKSGHSFRRLRLILKRSKRLIELAKGKLIGI
jgi:hypothetical protein